MIYLHLKLYLCSSNDRKEHAAFERKKYGLGDFIQPLMSVSNQRIYEMILGIEKTVNFLMAKFKCIPSVWCMRYYNLWISCFDFGRFVELFQKGGKVRNRHLMKIYKTLSNNLQLSFGLDLDNTGPLKEPA